MNLDDERRKRDQNIACAEELLYGTVRVEPGYTSAMLAANAHATVALVQDRIVERAEREQAK